MHPTTQKASNDSDQEAVQKSVLEQIKEDYSRFPEHQTYSLYAEDVQFKDPMNDFSGVQKYQQMIGFLARFFRDIDLELHSIEQTTPALIKTAWTLHMTAPAPWAPRLSIPGRSELGLNEQGLINSHIDYWNCSRLAVLKQVFS
ncbi:MAG: DUF2358 domain-containing protein [Cyanobacteria bacterium J06632_3]